MALVLLSLFDFKGMLAQNEPSKPKKIFTNVKSKKYLSSSILLWMRTDTPRQVGMARWKGPHSKIISGNKGLWEYRQIHFTENNSGLWPLIQGVETEIPTDRKIDGVADVTLKNIFSIFRGKKQNKLAFADEVNLFKRTILYAAFPNNSRWYNVSQPNEKMEARTMVFFRMKEGIREIDFKMFINEELTPTLANTGILKELRSKFHEHWKQKQWNTPNVAHDNPSKFQFQASMMLGFNDEQAMQTFFQSDEIDRLSERLRLFCSAIHAYRISSTLTFVKNGKIVSQ